MDIACETCIFRSKRIGKHYCQLEMAFIGGRSSVYYCSAKEPESPECAGEKEGEMPKEIRRCCDNCGCHLEVVFVGNGKVVAECPKCGIRYEFKKIRE